MPALLPLTDIEAPGTGGETDAVEDAARLVEWLPNAALQTIAALLVGALVLVLLRWAISRTVRSVVRGGTTVRKHAHRLLLRTGVGANIVESNPLAVARQVQRAETMGSVLRSSAALVVAIAVVTVLANIHDWDLGPLLASAGVVGVALGFGAQTLVKDFLSGIFMLIEDQYGVGDVVDLGEAAGVVEAIGLRVTQVRDLTGTLWYVRNGEILRVGNKTQGWSRALVEVRVDPHEDVERALSLLRTAAASIGEDADVGAHLLAEPEVTAFEDLTADSVLLRVILKTAPAKQWEVQRLLRERILEAFRAADLPLAIPRREVLVQRDEPGRPGARGADAAPDAAGRA